MDRLHHLEVTDVKDHGRTSLLGEVRLSHLLSAWVVHDLTHLAQVSRALASRYREEVGPWIDFLPILPARVRASTSAGTRRA